MLCYIGVCLFIFILFLLYWHVKNILNIYTFQIMFTKYQDTFLLSVKFASSTRAVTLNHRLCLYKTSRCNDTLYLMQSIYNQNKHQEKLNLKLFYLVLIYYFIYTSTPGRRTPKLCLLLVVCYVMWVSLLYHVHEYYSQNQCY